jgi:hypothetical protein
MTNSRQDKQSFEVLRSRIPQELAALQTDAMCEQLVGVIEGTQRIAQISLQTADEATRFPKSQSEYAPQANWELIFDRQSRLGR